MDTIFMEDILLLQHLDTQLFLTIVVDILMTDMGIIIMPKSFQQYLILELSEELLLGKHILPIHQVSFNVGKEILLLMLDSLPLLELRTLTPPLVVEVQTTMSSQE